jgi:serine/threonine-protein kinase RsbT
MNEIRLCIRTDGDLLTARQKARDLAGGLGFSTTEVTEIVTVVSELTRNILMYAGMGEVVLATVNGVGRRGIGVTAWDEGPGIADITKAMLDGYSTSGSLGLGLPGARRLMDEFSIESRPARGTRVSVKRWLTQGKAG